MYSDIQYKNPFLKEVILRIDFPAPRTELEKSVPDNLLKVILKYFPISEPQKVLAQEFHFSNDKIKTNSSETTEWSFHSNQRDKTLKIGPYAIVLIFKHYKSFEELSEINKEIMEAYYKKFKDIVANRIGLRYVNIIEPGDNNPLSWSEYINEKMLGIIDFNDQKESIIRAFHILEYDFDDLRVKFQFGIANPDYPAIIKKKQFVLDIDSYTNGAFELHEILEKLELAHAKVQELFEISITDKTRSKMG